MGAQLNLMEQLEIWLWQFEVLGLYDGLNVHTRVQKGKAQMWLEPRALNLRAGDGAKLKRGGVVNP